MNNGFKLNFMKRCRLQKVNWTDRRFRRKLTFEWRTNKHLSMKCFESDVNYRLNIVIEYPCCIAHWMLENCDWFEVSLTYKRWTKMLWYLWSNIAVESLQVINTSHLTNERQSKCFAECKNIRMWFTLKQSIYQAVANNAFQIFKPFSKLIIWWWIAKKRAHTCFDY